MRRPRESPDAVCARYARKKPSLRVALLDSDTILVEATRTGFRMLAQFSAAMATSSDAGFQISPRGPGNVLFARRAPLGLYLHRAEESKPRPGSRDWQRRVTQCRHRSRRRPRQCAA